MVLPSGNLTSGKKNAPVTQERIACILWLMNNTVRPCPATSFICPDISSKLSISNRQHFIHQQNFRSRCGRRKRQSDVHPTEYRFTGVSRNFHSENSTISSNFWSISFFLHPQNGTIHIDIFPPCQFGMKAGSHFSSEPPVHTSTRPAVGSVMRESTLSRVFFPAPFFPIIPTTSP